MSLLSEKAKTVVESDRLLLRELVMDDAPFILQLVNEPSWLQHIGDKNVHSIEDAVHYISSGPRKSYHENGFGLYLVVLKASGAPLGVCGLLKRITLDDPDIGFALLPEYWGQGYAYEAASAVLRYAGEELRIAKVAGITKAENRASIKLLEKLGMELEGRLRLSESESELLLFVKAIESRDVW
jgi:RimJ/RimL family protein N-acetyltransferase